MLDTVLDLNRMARQFGDTIALRAPGIEYTFEEYDRKIIAAADFLLTQKLTPDDRIGIVSANRPEFIIGFWSILRLGAMACLVNSRLPEPAALASLHEMGCSSVLRLTEDNSVPKAEGIRTTVLPPLERLSVSSQSPTLLPFEKPATVILTSGTAGKPKAIIHSIGNHFYSALGSNENIEVGEGDAWLVSLPLYHVGGLSIVFRCALAGAAVVLPENPSMSAVPEGVTHLSLVPTQLRRLLDDESTTRRMAKQAKAILIGGAAVPPDLIKRAHDADLPIHTSYGLTEMSSQVCTTPPGDDCTTSGRLLPYRHMRITDEGEVEVRGETRFWGMLEGGQPSPLDPMEWYATGDIGRLDEGDRLTIIGRVDSRFQSGGENIQPELIESALVRLDGIDDAMVVGVPDEEFGRLPVAMIRWLDSPKDEPVVLAQLAQVLPRYAIPRQLISWPDELADRGIKPSRAEATRLVRERLG